MDYSLMLLINSWVFMIVGCVSFLPSLYFIQLGSSNFKDSVKFRIKKRVLSLFIFLFPISCFFHVFLGRYIFEHTNQFYGAMSIYIPLIYLLFILLFVNHLFFNSKYKNK